MERTPSKNGGAASPVCQGKEGASAKTESHFEHKNVSSFCDDCRPGDPAYLGIRDFTDSEGKTWHCFKPFSCDHAVISIGKIVSCRVRTAEIRQGETAL